MIITDAQKRANKKYKQTYKIKNWQVDLKESDFIKIEEERKKQGLTRVALLKKIIENE
ncbi:MAG: hypothetical protein RSH79_01670 [Clostridiales bacterium]